MGVYKTLGDKYKNRLKMNNKGSDFTQENKAVANKGTYIFRISQWENQYGYIGLPSDVCIGISTCHSVAVEEGYSPTGNLNIRGAGLSPTYTSGDNASLFFVENWLGSSINMENVYSYLRLSVVSADCVKDGG